MSDRVYRPLVHAEVFTIATTGGVDDNRLLSMAAGGWERCEIAAFPAHVNVVLVGLIVYAPEDCGRSHVVSFSVEGSDGNTGSLGTMQIDPSTAAAVVKTPFAYPITLRVLGPVVLSLTATVEGGPTFGPTQFEVRRKAIRTGNGGPDGAAAADELDPLDWLA